MLPDNAAIVVAELNLDDILSRASTCTLNIVLLYDVCTSSGSTKEHQLPLETMTIDTDILHDKRFVVQFEANDCTCLVKRNKTFLYIQIHKGDGAKMEHAVLARRLHITECFHVKFIL